MTPLRTENLELKLNNNIASMSVTGIMSAETLDEGLAWMDHVTEAKEEFNICVDIAVEDFEGLGAARQEFLSIGRLLRHAGTAQKCAVLTDSLFLKNTAKVESAVIPGLEINAFDLSDTETAQSWLKDKPLTEPVKDEAVAACPAEDMKAAPQPQETTAKKNPWDSLDISKVDI